MIDLVFHGTDFFPIDYGIDLSTAFIAGFGISMCVDFHREPKFTLSLTTSILF